jgi:hypothetical protein
MELEIIMSSKISQAQNSNNTFSLICGNYTKNDDDGNNSGA